MRQQALPLGRAAAFGRDDFMTAPSNATAVALLDGWPDWPSRRLALTGPAQSGKSHLATIWAAEAGARIVRATDVRSEEAPALAATPLVVEDVDAAEGGLDEDALFHLWNACAQAGQGLLLTGRAPPSDWPAELPDLKSRLASLTPATIDDPEDTLLSVLLVKLFADRQLRIRPALIGFLLSRMERSHAAAAALVERLDAESLARGASPGAALARDILGDERTS